MTINELIDIVNGKINIKNNININKIKTDTRKIEKGDIFIALKGKKYDGHKFVKEALKKGAVFCITEEFICDKCIVVSDTYKALFDIGKYMRMKYDIPLVAVTGSNGKTTTKDLIYHILDSSYKVLKNDESKNNIVGVSSTLFDLNDSYDIIVMELGTNHLGEISYLSKMCKPNISVITNIGSSHLEYFKTRKNIFKEKYSVINGMITKNLVVNGDDKYLKKINCFKCGTNKNNDLIAYNIKENLEYIEFNIFIDKEYKVIFNNPGVHFVNDILLAIKIGLEYGINIKTIINRIETFKLNDKRMNIIKTNNNIIINDCYNSSLESIKAGLAYVKKIEGNKILIIADILELGKYSKSIHKKINKEIKKIKNVQVFTIGNYSKYIKGINFKTSDDFLLYLKNNIIDNSYIYIKGSRRMGLDKIVDYLIK